MKKQFSLVIVESPAKCKKIESILGKGFVCRASCGHVMELEKGLEAIDIKNGFEPKYRVTPSKRDVVSELKRMIQKSHTVYLAMDPDREGEAIAYQLANHLGILKTAKRSTFNEITKQAVSQAIQNPRTIDFHLNDAQKARRVLDRLVGFEISPLLWNHISSSLSLSAGRCQSPALDMLYQREEEIKAFQSQAYFAISGELSYQHNKKSNLIQVSLPKGADKIASLKTCATYLEASLPGVGTFRVAEVQETEHTSSAGEPFTTSTLQQEANNQLHINPKTTMSLAQNLYESGYITYMRTDSTALSEEAKKLIKMLIYDQFGKPYYQKTKKSSDAKAKTKKDPTAQEAHECIRPVDMDKIKIDVPTPAHQRLYELIWKRAVASQMKPKRYRLRQFDIPVEKDGEVVYRLSHTEENTEFPGHTILGAYLKSLNSSETFTLPTPEEWSPLSKSDSLQLSHLTGEEQDTRPKARYTAASLVKALEKSGIGRPSTYSAIITTLVDRQYAREGVQKTEYYEKTNLKIDHTSTEVEQGKAKKKKPSEKGKLFITEVGERVRNFLHQNFERLLEDRFTADIESKLDHIASGNERWSDVVQLVYDSFHPIVEKLQAAKPAGSKGNLREKLGEKGKDEFYRVRTKYGMAILKQPKEKKKGSFVSICEKLYEEGEDLTLQQAICLSSFPKTIHLKEGQKAQFCYGKHGFYLKIPSRDKKKPFQTVVVEGDWSHGKLPKKDMVQQLLETDS